MTAGVNVSKMNSMVLDYLVVNGYRDVAENFVQEAGLPPIDLKDIANRKQVSNLISQGKVEMAIDKISDIDSYFLDINSEIYFLLLELHMIELVKEALPRIDEDLSTAMPVLEFAESRIIPYINDQPVFERDKRLARVERVLSLICFPIEGPIPNILSPDYRNQVAAEVNKALLESRGQDGTSRLSRAVKTYVWAKNGVDSNK